MKMKKTISIGVLLILLLLFTQSLQSANDDETLAAQAADSWLALVDLGNYHQSWKEAATYFRNAVAPEQWVQSMVAFRRPLGNVQSRRLISKKYTRTLPGAPDGQYVVVQYETSFENKRHAIETVTPMLDKDMRWRVSGYFIK